MVAVEGNVLGLFGVTRRVLFDVSVQKARTEAFFSKPRRPFCVHGGFFSYVARAVADDILNGSSPQVGIDLYTGFLPDRIETLRRTFSTEITSGALLMSLQLIWSRVGGGLHVHSGCSMASKFFRQIPRTTWVGRAIGLSATE